MFELSIILFILVGVIAGFFAGLLGIGGSVLVIPMLTAIFTFLSNIPQQHFMHIVIATSLSSMILNTLVSSISQFKRNNINFQVVRSMGLGIIVGALVGPKISVDIPSQYLKMIFGIFICCFGCFLFLRSKRKTEKDASLPSFTPLTMIGFSVSTISTILGISGGLFTVPILQGFHMPMKKAIGTSSATSFIATLIGSIGYFLFSNPLEVGSRFGFIYLPAFISISLATIIFAPIGVKVSHRFHSVRLKRIFSLVIFCAGIYMVITG